MQADDNHFVPRSVLIDLEPRVVNNIAKGVYGRLYNPENIFVGDGSGAGNNWAVGYKKGAEVGADG